MAKTLEERLRDFACEHRISTKGPLSLVIQFTRMIQGKPFPLNPNDFQTAAKGQVAGLGGGNLKKILKEHGISQQLSAEGGRTSRGSLGLMQKYVEFLNEWHSQEEIDLKRVEDFWAERVRDYFKGKPFALSVDSSKSLSANLDDLFSQARNREKQNPGTHYLGTVLQHLVAAKLSLILPAGKLRVLGASVADAPTSRTGDFVLGNNIIHCTTMPGDLLMTKCESNLEAGCTPIIITLHECVSTARTLANFHGICQRVEVWDIQQLLSTNLHEQSLFEQIPQTRSIAALITKYNEIIDTVETDPSLKIDFSA